MKSSAAFFEEIILGGDNENRTYYEPVAPGRALAPSDPAAVGGGQEGASPPFPRPPGRPPLPPPPSRVPCAGSEGAALTTADPAPPVPRSDTPSSIPLRWESDP